MKAHNWKNEDELWAYLETRLLGWWRRLEVSYPAGLCDSVGLHDGRTIWLEHKVGLPGMNKFTPGQLDFAAACQRHRVPYYTCFGHLKKVLFFEGLKFEQPILPVWWLVTP